MKQWRDDFIGIPLYRKRLAILPTKLVSGETIWFKYYYSKYMVWVASHPENMQDTEWSDFHHKDFVERISTVDFIFRSLADTR
jgi:hypothetical protein